MANNGVLFNAKRIPMKGVRYVEGADQWAIYMGKRKPLKRNVTEHPMEAEVLISSNFSEPEDINTPPFFLPFRKPNEQSKDWTIIDLDESDSEDTPLERMVFKRRALRICAVRRRKLESFRVSMKKYTDELDKFSKHRNEWAKEILSKLAVLNQQMQRNS